MQSATGRTAVRGGRGWEPSSPRSSACSSSSSGSRTPRRPGWTAALTIGSLVAGVVLLAAFALAERRVSQPLLPLRVIADRARGGSYISVGLTGIAVFGVFLFLTYYLQLIKGYSPVTSGLAFLPMIACILLASNTSSIVLLPRVGPRNPDRDRHAAGRRLDNR